MSIFNILDVKYTKDDARVFDPLQNSASGRGNYSDNLRYPIDLGSADKSHYVFFTIFQQEDTAFPLKFTSGLSAGQQDIQRIMDTGGTVVGEVAAQTVQTANRIETAVASEIKNSQIGQVYTSIMNKFKSSEIGQTIVPVGRAATDGFSQGVQSTIDRVESITGQNFLRRIKKISNSIALYMPDTLAFNYNQSYTDVSMYSGKFGQAAVGASALSQLKSGMSTEQVAKLVGSNMSPFLSGILNQKLGAPGSAIAAAAFGGVQNPSLELLYTNPSFRDFQFDFMFYPRSEKEATEVYNIINDFKFHQAPEIKSGTAGFFLIPPSMFNIEFHYNGKVNENLPKISDCVLTGISVDYAPNGWAAYEVPGKLYAEQGATGSPVGTRMTLTFKETIIHTKATHTKGSTNIRINR